jgi:predicted KAP-like P-loop ATPase
MEDATDVLSADRPLSEPQDDQLGYAPLARNLADSLLRMTPPDGFVVAIYGRWGLGKTTLLQFVEYYYQERSRGEQPIFIHFNPWWFSGHEDLTRQFFGQIQATLSGKLKAVSNELRGYLADFTELIAGVPVPYAAAGRPVSMVLRPKLQDIPDVKGQISALLRKQQRRILVVVDDIDRLTAEEIREIFRVIRAVADFPHVTYLLAFDKDVVVQALETAQGVPAEVYLEKVIQLPLELPLPDKSKLENMLIGRLNALLANIPKEHFDRNYWKNVFIEGIRPLLHTPRDVIRLTNAVAVTYPAVKDGVNPVDLVGIETLRAFSPSVYDTIRRHPRDFARPAETKETSSSQDTSSPPQDLKSRYNSLLDSVPEEERDTIKRLLGHLFPRVATIWGGSTYGPEWDTEWRKHLHARCLDIFPVYFNLTLSEEEGISHAEMEALLALAQDAKAFGAKLVEISRQKKPDVVSRIRDLLDQLQDYAVWNIAVEHIPSSARLVNEEQLKELEAIALGKIRYAAQHGTLLASPRLPALLQRYRDWAGDAEVKQWVHEAM